MPANFKPTRILGHVINTSPSAMNARESSTEGYIPEDIHLLTSLRVLQKNKANLGSEEEIRQFFRWAAAEEKYPLPPLVRKILCMNRAKLVDAKDSMKTTDPLRTYEKNAIAEIDRFLREDGVTNPEFKESCERTDRKGAWLKGGVTPSPPLPTTESCDLKPILDKLDEVKMMSKANMEELKTVMKECCVKESCGENQENVEHVQNQLEVLRQETAKTIAQLQTKLEAANTKEQELNAQLASLREQVTENVSQRMEVQQADSTRQISELQQQLRLAQDQVQNLQEQLRLALSQASNAQTEVNTLQEEQEEQITNLQEQLRSAQDQVANFQQRSQNVQRQEGDLQEQLRLAQEKAGQVEDLQEQLRLAQEKAGQVEGLQEQLRLAQEKAGQAEGLQEQLRLAQEKAGQAEGLQEQLRLAQEKAGQVEDLQEQRRLAQTQIVDLTQMNNSSSEQQQEITLPIVPSQPTRPTRPINDIGISKLGRYVSKTYNTRSLARPTTPNNYSNKELERAPIVRLKSIPYEKRTKTIRNRIDRILDKPKRATLKRNTQRILDRIQKIIGESSNIQRQNSLKKLRSDETISKLNGKSLVNSILPQNLIDNLDK